MIWKQEKMLEVWKESLLVSIHKKGPKTDCNKYRGISMLLVCYKIFTFILTNRITEYAEEIIRDYQCSFRRYRSTVDQIFSLRQILEKKLEDNQLFINFKKAYDSIDRQQSYNVLIELGIPRKLVSLVRMCLTETFNKVRIDNYFSERFELHSGSKQRDSLSSVLFNLALEYAIRKVIGTKKGLNLGGPISALGYTDDLVLLEDDTEILKLNTTTLMEAGKELGLEINTEKTKYKVSRRNGDDYEYLIIGAVEK